MNYLRLINQFWKLRRSKRITSKQADLYFFLIQEANGRDWENPFECSNISIIASIDMKEPTLIDARNRLKQLGLIEFRGGKRNEASPMYELLYLNNLSRNRDESIDETEEKPEEKAPLSYKQNKTKRKPKEESKEEKFLINPFSEKFLLSWERWKNYKKTQFSFSYKSLDTEQTAFDDLLKLSANDETRAIELIGHAIAKGWKGIYPKKENNGNQQPVNGNSKQGTSEARIQAARNF
jgi:hypothetical protein